MKLSSVSSRYAIHRADARIVRRLAAIPEVISVAGGTAALDPLEFHRKDIICHLRLYADFVNEHGDPA